MRWLILLFGLLAVHANAAGTGPGAYKIGGIDVDVVAANPADARAAAYREAQQKAWPLLWNRLTSEAPSSAPRLGDGAIEAMVAGVEVQAEQFSMTRYIGRLAIVFDRSRTSGYLGGTIGAEAAPMLLLPVTYDGGVRVVYQSKTPWIAAWQRFRDAASVIDYVVVTGNAGDNVLLTAYQTRRSDRGLWRNILSRFHTRDVLTSEVVLDRSYPGGPVSALFIARHGPDAVELGRVSLRTGTAAGLDAMLDEGVRQVDAIYVRALRDGRLQSEKGLITELEPLVSASPDIGAPVGMAVTGGVEVNVVTPDAAAWAQTEALLRGTPTVTGVALTSLSLGGTSRIVIRFSETSDMLAYQLDQRGLRLVQAEGGTLLRRKEPGDAPIARPLTAAELNSAEVIAEPDAVAPNPADADAKPIAPAKPSAKTEAPVDLLPPPAPK